MPISYDITTDYLFMEGKKEGWMEAEEKMKEVQKEKIQAEEKLKEAILQIQKEREEAEIQMQKEREEAEIQRKKELTKQVLLMHQTGMSIEDIAMYTMLTVERVQQKLDKERE